MLINVTGLGYGDEAKGRCSAWYGEKYNADWFVKYNGANNAGHTVYKDGIKYALRHLPAGSLFGKKVIIDTGALINLPELKKELSELPYKVDLYISNNVHLILPEHLEADSQGSQVGSTKKGIAYAYADRALRKGIRVTQSWLDEYDIDAILYKGLPPFTTNDVVLFESSQGLMLDIDYGEYPFVTSSSILPSGVYKIDLRVGVLKAYTTKVGIHPTSYEEVPGLSEKGGEFGTVTGRRRQSYWNDVDELKFACSIVQPDEMVMTKIDILKDVPKIFIRKGGELLLIGNLDSYLNYMLENFPKIKYLSDSPQGELLKI
jgi:adenylosuccinate synthase